MPVPKLLSLKEAAQALGGAVTPKILRAEVHSGALKCVRVRPGRNAKILFREKDLVEWLEVHAASRQEVPPFDI